MTKPAIAVKSEFNVIYKEVTASTNKDAKLLATEGNFVNTVIWAGEQQEGRGRYDREWVSKPGNLYMSILLKTDADIAIKPQLSFISALAVRDAIESNEKIYFKWPNDLILENKKFGGILLEGGDGYIIIGIGVNINSFPENTDFPATCLAGIEAESLLHNIIESFSNWLAVWQEEEFSSIRAEWLNHAIAVGEEIEVRLANDIFKGKFKDLDDDGSLILELSDGSLKTISAGDVFF